jgi:hypothetical protein
MLVQERGYVCFFAMTVKTGNLSTKFTSYFSITDLAIKDDNLIAATQDRSLWLLTI